MGKYTSYLGWLARVSYLKHIRNYYVGSFGLTSDFIFTITISITNVKENASNIKSYIKA